MIRSKLRSSLMTGAVLLNAVALASPAECFAATPAPRVAPVPILAALQPQSPAKVPVLKRVDATIAKASKRGLFDIRHGLASWYGKVLDGHRTASGERFDCTDLTAASNTLPLGTQVKVTNLANGLTVIVRINDRGILSEGRIIDLSSAAAEQLDMLRTGVSRVKLDIIPAGA